MRKSLVRCANVALLLIICFAVTGAFVSCQRRALEDPDFYTRLQVKVNVNTISNVTCDIYNPKIPVPEIDPEVMHVLFYDTEGTKLLAESFISEGSVDADGNKTISGNVSILPGDYKIIIYQFGEEHTLFDNYSTFADFRAYTDPLSETELKNLKLKSIYTTSGQVLRYQPDHCIATALPEETIPYHRGVYTIESESSSLVESYYLQVGIKGGSYISYARAIITSMSAGKNVQSFSMELDNPSALYVPLVKSDDKGNAVLCNVFNTFGRIPDADNKLSVTFDITTTDGTVLQKEYDLSDLFETEDAIKHHWLIIDDVIDIPEPPNPDEGGGGFTPSVDDWEEENHVIEL